MIFVHIIDYLVQVFGMYSIKNSLVCVSMRFRRRGDVSYADNVSLLTTMWPRGVLLWVAIGECSFGHIIPLPTMMETGIQSCHCFECIRSCVLTG
jgi:hypothetical protein